MEQLDHRQREQLKAAIMEAFPDYSALEQLVDATLDIYLQKITPDKEFSSVVFDLIKWARSKGRVADLVEGAYQSSPTSPLLKVFYQTVWQSLIDKQPELQSSNILWMKPQECSSRRASPVEEIEPSPQFSEKRLVTQEEKTNDKRTVLLSIDKKIEAARAGILIVADLIQPEKEIYDNQCLHSIQRVNKAHATTQQIPDELAQLPFTHIPARYLLMNELAYFTHEVERVTALLQQLSSQTASLSLRKVVWNVIGRLIDSLQKIAGLISIIGQYIDKNQENEQNRI